MPTMTALLNGQAVKVWLASTSVTVMRGSIRLMKRAQLAPAKPPPTTTTRPPAPCAMAGSGSIAAETPAAARLRNSRRLSRCPLMSASSVLLRAVPGGDGFDLVLGQSLGDAIHHGAWQLAGFERLHGGDQIGGIATDQPWHRGVHEPGGGMAAGAGCSAGRGIRQPGGPCLGGHGQ